MSWKPCSHISHYLNSMQPGCLHSLYKDTCGWIFYPCWNKLSDTLCDHLHHSIKSMFQSVMETFFWEIVVLLINWYCSILYIILQRPFQLFFMYIGLLVSYESLNFMIPEQTFLELPSLWLSQRRHHLNYSPGNFDVVIFVYLCLQVCQIFLHYQ